MRQFTAWTEAHLNRMALCTTKRKSQEIALVVLIQWVLRLLASTVWLGGRMSRRRSGFAASRPFDRTASPWLF